MGRGASGCGVFLVAAPYDRAVGIVGVPDLSSIKAPALAANDPAGKKSFAAVSVAELSAALQFQLCELEDLVADDGGMDRVAAKMM